MPVAGCDLLFPINAPEGDTDGPTIDAAVPVDANLRCLADSFDDATVDPTKWNVFNTGTAVSTGAELQIVLGADADTIGGVVSLEPLDITETTSRAYLIEVTNLVGQTETVMMLELDAVNRYRIATSTGQIIFSTVVDGAATSTQFTYEAGAHRYWRMQHTSNPSTMHFETSADGSMWIEHHATPAPFTWPLKVVLFADSFNGGTANPGRARFDDFRLERGNCVN